MSEIDPTEVEVYLQQHPEFFNERESLLEHISIPHPSGNAVSLVSKQLELFRLRHHKMEGQLDNFIKVAQENDRSANKVHELTLAVLEAGTFVEAVNNLNVVLAECFLADFCSVKIIRPYQNNPALAHLFIDPDCAELDHFSKEMRSNKAYCGRPTLAQAEFLFSADTMAVKSCVIIPMIYAEIEGVIAVGSKDVERFHYTMGDLFLTQMSEIIATRFAALLNKT